MEEGLINTGIIIQCYLCDDQGGPGRSEEWGILFPPLLHPWDFVVRRGGGGASRYRHLPSLP